MTGNRANIALVAAETEEAQVSLARLRGIYGDVDPVRADVVVALGGDGFMLETLHRFSDRETPIYGMNRGTFGFLMNMYEEDGLRERIAAASAVMLHPLRMTARDERGESHTAMAVNEVALLRQTRQAARLRIEIDGVARLDNLVCDGALVATPAGSTAYNLSAHGPVVPLIAQVLALTPISAFRPRRWRGALLPHNAHVAFTILEPEKRPVSATADSFEVRRVTRVEVREDRSVSMRLLFDPEHDLEERILKEQFTQ